MKFKVYRTSLHSFTHEVNEPPCQEAKFINDSWIIEIKFLDELAILLAKYERLVLVASEDLLNDLPELEIYDTFRE